MSAKDISVLQFPRILVRKDKLRLEFLKSSGPGGQNVNKRNTKVKVGFNINEATWIPEDVKLHFLKRNENLILPNQDLIITCQKYRTQDENRLSCERRIQKLLDETCDDLNGIVPATEKAMAKIKRNKAKNRSRAKKKLDSNETT